MSTKRLALCRTVCGIFTIMSALLSQMVQTMLYMNLEVSSAFNFGLKPGAAFDSDSVAHRLISPLVFWLRPHLVSATSGMAGLTLHWSRWMSSDLYDLSLQLYLEIF